MQGTETLMPKPSYCILSCTTSQLWKDYTHTFKTTIHQSQEIGKNHMNNMSPTRRSNNCCYFAQNMKFQSLFQVSYRFPCSLNNKSMYIFLIQALQSN